LSWQIAGVGDVDGDGRADLVWRNTQTGDVAAWLMNGATVAQSLVVSSGVPLIWQIVRVADVNGDGKADLVWHNTSPQSIPPGAVAVWLMNGGGVTQAPVLADQTPFSLAGPIARREVKSYLSMDVLVPIIPAAA
jgi:hypothetical protein